MNVIIDSEIKISDIFYYIPLYNFIQVFKIYVNPRLNDKTINGFSLSH